MLSFIIVLLRERIRCVVKAAVIHAALLACVAVRQPRQYPEREHPFRTDNLFIRSTIVYMNDSKWLEECYFHCLLPDDKHTHTATARAG